LHLNVYCASEKVASVVTLCAQLTRDLLAIAKFLVYGSVEKLARLEKLISYNFALRTEAGPPPVVNTTDDDCEQQVPSVA